MSLPYDSYASVLQVIDCIGRGYTKSRACDDCGISVQVFNNYVKNNEDVRDMLVAAEDRCYDAMADALINPQNHFLYGHTDPRFANIQSSNIKWFLDKKKPSSYGTRVQVDHTITADKAIIQALHAGMKRALPGQVVDADYEDVLSEDEEAEMAALLA